MHLPPGIWIIGIKVLGPCLRRNGPGGRLVVAAGSPIAVWPGNDPAHTLAALDAGHNVAVVFDCKKSDPLPETWQGVPVIDGRTHDFRFTDPAGVVVGLSALGSAKGSALAL